MGVFITVRIDYDKCVPDCSVCADICPVKIFVKDENRIEVEAHNEDECILCDICTDRCPQGAIEIKKNY